MQQQKRKKWWSGQWGKSTYETTWVQEIERHLGGRESSILKQDEHKKLLRDMPPPTFRPPSQVLLWNLVETAVHNDECDQNAHWIRN